MQKVKNNIIFSVVMPTYNSEKTLEMSLKSIESQNFDSDFIEVIMVDGGSTDNTIEIGKDYGAMIVNNPKRLPEYAKEIGIKNANGKYIIFHDSDEVILNKNSFMIKEKILKENQLKTIISSGCVNPIGYSGWGEYTNLIGDPFTAFVYGRNPESNVKRYQDMYHIKKKTNTYLLCEVDESSILPIIDAAGHTFPKETYNNTSIANISSKNILDTGLFAVTINDDIEHYSSSSLFQVLKKIKFRVINNVFGDEHAGYVSRESSIPKKYIIKKYLFLLYGFSILFPFLRGIYWSMKTKKNVFLYEPILSLYTSLIITYNVFLKAIGYNKKNIKY